ncbi:MAG TPA: Mrp/NBP35 family ATP-binding protein [Candidatus Borkfalkia excrementigallinarum]|uniref:Iron-sulfur cluster carrier protein n=1 Tax=Candidatus Borkfalkia excrementigallinarum TaxID=2838506 RepID=A0A9D1ZVG3_9FIRM|nr:Mrp/NBP35 family ATP-binding protein [Candidatus Borkfalkia excrementigallinarum]
MAECTHDCGSCGEDCAQRDMHKKPHELSNIKKVIGIVSGKGGVGKSLTTAMLAVTAQRNGFKTAVLDADITGPSIPKMFGITDKAMGTDMGILPAISKTGIEIMSMNLLLEEDTDPVIWRGPIIAGTVLQFWTDVIWNDVDYMFVDMPPGTGDVPLSIYQSIPLDGIIVVTTPQELVSMIVKKAVIMAEKMNIPVLGLVENMSYVQCPDCGKRIEIFGKSGAEELAKQFGAKGFARVPFDNALTKCADRGLIELFEGDYVSDLFEKIE